MNKIIKKAVAFSLAAGLSLSTLTSCGSGNSKLSVKDTKYEITDNSEVLFDLGKSTITYGEMMYYVAYFEMLGEYQRAYYEASMGYTGDFWSEVDETGNVESANYKNNAFQEANYVEVMKNAAIDEGITLTEEDLADIDKSTKEAVDIYSEDIKKKAGITYEGFYSTQKTMAYSTKYVDKLKEEYKNSDKYKQAMEAIKKEENLAYDVNYAYISLSGADAGSAEKLEKSNAVISEIHDKVAAGTEFTAIQDSYKDDTSVVFGSKVIAKNDNSMDATILEELSKLENDQVSGVITTDYGLFVFQMNNNASEEKYQELLSENSDKVIESMVKAKYAELNAEYTIEANEKLVESIEMGKMTIAK